jgi:hypothetical protein
MQWLLHYETTYLRCVVDIQINNAPAVRCGHKNNGHTNHQRTSGALCAQQRTAGALCCTEETCTCILHSVCLHFLSRAKALSCAAPTPPQPNVNRATARKNTSQTSHLLECACIKTWNRKCPCWVFVPCKSMPPCSFCSPSLLVHQDSGYEVTAAVLVCAVQEGTLPSMCSEKSFVISLRYI